MDLVTLLALFHLACVMGGSLSDASHAEWAATSDMAAPVTDAGEDAVEVLAVRSTNAVLQIHSRPNISKKPPARM